VAFRVFRGLKKIATDETRTKHGKRPVENPCFIRGFIFLPLLSSTFAIFDGVFF
jgi:hypothetical protein